jgi:transposase
LPSSVWALGRLSDRMAERTGIRAEHETVRVHLKAAGRIVLSRPQRTIAGPDPEYAPKKGDRRDPRRPPRSGRRLLLRRRAQPELDAHPQGDVWSPKGQRVTIPAPAQPEKRYGIGAVDHHTGETVDLIRRRERRRETAELLEALLEKHPTGRVYVAWDDSNTHEDDEVEAVLRGAAGRLVLLYLPTYGRWLNPIEMLWRHFGREVTHCELFPNVKALVAAAYDFFERYDRCPWRVLSIIGSDPAEIT